MVFASIQAANRRAIGGDAFERLAVQDLPGGEQKAARERGGVTRRTVLVGIAPVHRLDARILQRRYVGTETHGRLGHAPELIRF